MKMYYARISTTFIARETLRITLFLDTKLNYLVKEEEKYS